MYHSCTDPSLLASQVWWAWPRVAVGTGVAAASATAAAAVAVVAVAVVARRIAAILPPRLPLPPPLTPAGAEAASGLLWAPRSASIARRSCCLCGWWLRCVVEWLVGIIRS